LYIWGILSSVNQVCPAIFPEIVRFSLMVTEKEDKDVNMSFFIPVIPVSGLILLLSMHF
jgi:hypothetical protein